MFIINFSHFIAELSGRLKVQEPLDMETKQKFKLTVTATDKGTPPLSTETFVEIQIVDVNDNYPM